MNFDATRLAVLSGLSTGEETKTLTESANTGSRKRLREGCGCAAQPCGCAPPTEPEAQYEMSHDDEDDVLFEVDEDLDEDKHEEMNEDDDFIAPSLTHDESTVLDMDTLRETVIELRNEILEEQAAKKQALAEAPARKAIRKEIQSLLSEMPGEAATNWMYGKKGRPSASDTAAANKSRATALFGLGFETK